MIRRSGTCIGCDDAITEFERLLISIDFPVGVRSEFEFPLCLACSKVAQESNLNLVTIAALERCAEMLRKESR